MSWLGGLINWLTNRQPAPVAIALPEAKVVTTPAAPVEVAPPPDPMILYGEHALAEAQRLWALDIVDPALGSKHPQASRWLAVINQIIHAAGWTWIKYEGNTRDVKKACQWCGLFAAACWRAAGIDTKWLATFWASTVRLDYWERGRAWNGTPAGGPRPCITLSSKSKPSDARFPDGTLPRAGDVAVIGDETPKEGDHILIVVSYDPVTGTLKTISGNGGGLGPDGIRREGIVKTDYYVGRGAYHVLRVYRPLLSDMKVTN